MLVQVRGERVERTALWSAFQDAATFGSFLRAVVPPEVSDESVIALHLLFGETLAGVQMRSGSPPAGEIAAERGRALNAWCDPLPRSTAPAWLPRHQNALKALAEVHFALAAADSYLAWQRTAAFAAEFSLLGAWCSDGGNPWQFEP